jgi:hypothetical protein
MWLSCIAMVGERSSQLWRKPSGGFPGCAAQGLATSPGALSKTAGSTLMKWKAFPIF